MANRTITGTSGVNSGATVTNPLDSEGVPNTVRTSVEVSLDNASAPGSATATFFNVNMGTGDDTLVAENMVWATGTEANRIAFDNVNMGFGNDFVSLDRSAVRGILDTGNGNDTVELIDSYVTSLDLGAGNDHLVIGPSGVDISEEEAEAKAAATVPPTTLGGAGGTDTLELYGEWTVTLTGVATVNGVTTNILTSENMWRDSVLLPPVLNGTVSWGTIQAGSVTVDRTATFTNFEALNVICFTAGTMVETPNGLVAIETLKAGDLVVTTDGVKPLSWIGKRHLSIVDLAGNPKLLPVLIPAGSFGNGLPTEDVRFSPQHRVVVRSAIAQRMFGAQEVLAPVKHLIGYNGIEIDGEAQEVTYIHLMFDTHTCVQVYGIMAETMYPGVEAFKMVPEESLVELREIFGSEIDAIIDGSLVKDSYLPMLKGREARALVARHSKNSKPLLI
ncbi:Hint domain-containing protein [Paracoccus sp. (in: a-proteobacteria)]|uniref:Hint domain-containing protein n=1 Tax=Paracoccus sp. TaxID=267 RepID=UPI0028B07A88|nr:Hint domain-containing protein [Paracoccus sp. (in: a-proteobacteria)]